MLRTRGRTARARRPKGVAFAAAALAAAVGISGCSAAAAADKPAPIQATGAYVPLPITPGMTDAYLAIRNYTSQPDRLVSASSSVGGRVELRAPAGGGLMHSVPSITIPANSVVRLVPDGPHLLITGAGQMQNGKTFTLTLVFSHGSRIAITALVTNPQDTQGSNYSMN